MSFAKTLENKNINYSVIDYERMPRIYAKIKDKIKTPKVIHIIGTNAKGTTGRFIASYLHEQNLSVGHYTSPHILSFHERIWLNGADIDDTSLELAYKKLMIILSKEDIESLSYFEYLTIIAMLCFESCEYVILEAGLGGEYDATTVFDNILTIVTPIGFDHESYLGDTIKKIATTKLKAIKKEAIIAPQEYKEVYEVLKDLNLSYERVDGDISFLDKTKLTAFLKQNLKVAIQALKKLGFEVDIEKLKETTLNGRCQKVAKNITIDVGHNELAAKALVKEFENKKVILIFNMLEDKKLALVLAELKPIVKKIEILQIDSQRATAKQTLEEEIKKAGFEVEYFKTIDPLEEYLVFGSFLTVESFLKRVTNEK